MAHDEHFLQRLDRLSDEHIALALTLYREPVFVRAAIDAAGIGTVPERVSIELTDRPMGPRVLVARDGAFVTCLGEGMANGPWPRIKRATLDAAMGRIERALATVAEVTKHSLPEWKAMVRSIYERGPWMTREEVKALRIVATLMPLLSPFRMVAQYHPWLAMQREVIDAPYLSALSDARLKEIWCFGWSIFHNTTLSVMSAKYLAEYVADTETTLGAEPLRVMTGFTQTASLVGIQAGLFRSAQLAFHTGKTGLAAAKWVFAGHFGQSLRLVIALGGLLAHAIYGSKTQAEAEKYLRVSIPDSPKPRDEPEIARRMAIGYRALGGTILDAIRSDPELPRRLLREVAWRSLAPEHRANFGNKEELPDNLLVPLAAQSFTTVWGQENEVEAMYIAPVLAAAEPEELYLPAEHKALAFPKFYTAEKLEELARAGARIGKTRTPTVNHGRNALCSCGSRKKFKRCCGK
ncbi:MAG: SEC-C domain-containing protein [Myxococcales bacterium]|nr:SEC-C domain-containing protein [Myxococcales bacterium]